MALPADCFIAVLFEPCAHRLRLLAGWRREVGRRIGRRRRRRRAHQFIQHPRSAKHRGGSIAIGRSQQNRAFAEQAAARRFRQRHAPKLRTKDRFDAVVTSQTLVEEPVVGGQQLDNTAIFLKNTAYE